jgi:hypothetical protein
MVERICEDGTSLVRDTYFVHARGSGSPEFADRKVDLLSHFLDDVGANPATAVHAYLLERRIRTAHHFV